MVGHRGPGGDAVFERLVEGLEFGGHGFQPGSALFGLVGPLLGVVSGGSNSLFGGGELSGVLLGGQVGDRQTEGQRLGLGDDVGRHHDRDGVAFGVVGQAFVFGGLPAAGLLEHRLPFADAFLHQQVVQPASNDGLQRSLEEVGEVAVAVEDGSVGTNRQGPLLHLLDQEAVGPLGGLQGIDALALGAVDHHRIDRSPADGLECLLGLGKLEAQFFQLQAEALVSCGRIVH